MVTEQVNGRALNLISLAPDNHIILPIASHSRHEESTKKNNMLNEFLKLKKG